MKLVDSKSEDHKFVIALADGPQWQQGSLLEMRGNYIHRIISPRNVPRENLLKLVSSQSNRAVN